MNKIPTFYIDINPDDFETGMTTISLVDEPAIERDFIAFDKTKHINFSADNMEHKISGPAIIADMPIYRYNPSMGEYYIVFTKEVIEKIVEKYSKQGFFNMVNLQHDENQYVECAIMTEFYIKDSTKGIVPTGFEDVADGSLFCTYKITDDNLWDEIVNGDKLNGFSIEIMGDLKVDPVRCQSEQSKPIDSIIDEYITSYQFDGGSIEEKIVEAIKNRYIVMMNYDDEQEDAATGMRQLCFIDWGLTTAGNSAVRAYQLFGDTKTVSPDYKLFRLDRIISLRIIGFMEPWAVEQLDSRLNEYGDDGLLVVYDHYNDFH